MRVVLLGPPGAGKGTQAVRLCAERGFLHLSTGDLLRAAVKEGTETGKRAKSYMDRGALVPDDVVLALLRDRLKTAPKGSGFVLDGFPRNVAQARALDQDLGPAGIERVVHLKLDDDEIVRRLLGRGRPDDTEPVIRNRLKVYRDETAPLIRHYEGRGLLVTIDARGAVDDIYGRLKGAIAGGSPARAPGPR